MIDLAVGCHIALDGATFRRLRLGFRPALGTVVPRWHGLALPDAGALGAGRRFLLDVAQRIPGEGPSVTLAHHPGVHVLLVDKADAQRPPVLVEPAWLAAHLLGGKQ